MRKAKRRGWWQRMRGSGPAWQHRWLVTPGLLLPKMWAAADLLKGLHILSRKLRPLGQSASNNPERLDIKEVAALHRQAAQPSPR